MIRLFALNRMAFGLVPLFMAACLIFSQQSAFAANNCSIKLGTGRCMVEGDLDLNVLAINGKDVFIREAAEERGDTKILMKDRKFRFKSVAMLDWLREIFRTTDPDIMILTEMHKIEDAEDLFDLDTEGLRGKYYVFLKQGNSDRGINIAIAVKKDLGFKFKLTSHISKMWTDPVTKNTVPLFARDLPVLELTRPGEETPSLIIIGNHAKSKRDSPGDKESFRYRSAEYEEAKNIINELRAKYGPKVRILFGGDGNTDMVSAPESKPIRDVLKSVFISIPGKVYSYAQRVTHFFFGHDGAKKQALDDILVGGDIQVLDAQVLPYKKASGEIIPEPSSYDEREKLPSDHRPVFTRIRLFMQKLAEKPESTTP